MSNNLSNRKRIAEIPNYIGPDFFVMNLQILDKILKEITEYQLKINELIVCKRCGWCCKSCYPALNEDDIANIIRYLGIDFNMFCNTYMEQNAVDNYLKTPCPFLSENNSCKIYSVRPLVCRVFPFEEFKLIIDPCKLGEELERYINQIDIANQERRLRHKCDPIEMNKTKEVKQKETKEFHKFAERFNETLKPPPKNDELHKALILHPNHFKELYKLLKQKGLTDNI